MPSYDCGDGTLGGPTGRCLANADGSCGWEVRECPAADGGPAPTACFDKDGKLRGLAVLSTPEEYRWRDEFYYDWRLAVVRQLGNVEVHAALSGGGPGKQFYYGERHSRTRLTAGASWSF